MFLWISYEMGNWISIFLEIPEKPCGMQVRIVLRKDEEIQIFNLWHLYLTNWVLTMNTLNLRHSSTTHLGSLVSSLGTIGGLKPEKQTCVLGVGCCQGWWKISSAASTGFRSGWDDTKPSVCIDRQFTHCSVQICAWTPLSSLGCGAFKVMPGQSLKMMWHRRVSA